MTDIVTITMNPSIDLSVTIDRMEPFHKLRCTNLRRDPGGGGINVARVLKRLGADVTAIYTTGGSLGLLLRTLVDREGIPGLTMAISGETREDLTVYERSTGMQYRVIMPGPPLTEPEWRAPLALIERLDPHHRFIVGSGSLPPGVPDDFYCRVAHLARTRDCRTVIDASGTPLAAALETGVYLIKTSLDEFEHLAGARLATRAEQIAACRAMIGRRQAEVVALTLSNEGALAVTREHTLWAKALSITPASVVGAGDSFLGAMIYSLATNHTVDDALRYGAASGSAALLLPGTELARRDDIQRLVRDVMVEELGA
jgi:6-phosphofructokinase 2